MFSLRNEPEYKEMDLNKAMALINGSLKYSGDVWLISAWQWLVDSGEINKINPAYLRIAKELLSSGKIEPAIKPA